MATSWDDDESEPEPSKSGPPSCETLDSIEAAWEPEPEVDPNGARATLRAGIRTDILVAAGELRQKLDDLDGEVYHWLDDVLDLAVRIGVAHGEARYRLGAGDRLRIGHRQRQNAPRAARQAAENRTQDTQRVEHEIRDLAASYRVRHPYDRGDHSTRRLSEYIAEQLTTRTARPNTVRGHLQKLKLK